MDLSEWKWRDWAVMSFVGLMVLIALTAIYPGFAAVGRWWNDLDGPAWVQAIGSVLAIVAAIAIARHQQAVADEKESKRLRWERMGYAREVFLAIQEASRTLNYIAKMLGERVNLSGRMRTERIESLEVTFQTLSAKALPVDLLPYVLSVQRELSYTLMALRGIREVGNVSIKRVQNAELRATIVNRELELCRNRHDIYMWVGGIPPSTPAEGILVLDDMVDD